MSQYHSWKMYDGIVIVPVWLKCVWLLFGIVAMINVLSLCYSGLFFELGIVIAMAGAVFMFIIDELHNVIYATPRDHV